MGVANSKAPAANHYPDLNLAGPSESDPTEEKESGWLISFVDILTLLLTLFVLLLAFNQISQREQPRHTTPPAPTPAATLVHDNLPPQQAPTAEPSADFTIPQDIRDKVEMLTTSNEVNLVIKDDVLFDEGSPDLKATGAAVLERIAQLLDQNNYPVSVEGHTDNIPIHTAQFPSNWELSTFRATTVTRYFIDHGIAVDRLRAIGYADTHPIADNGTAAGRARNRRVSLVIHVNESPTATRPAAKNPDKSPSGS